MLKTIGFFVSFVLIIIIFLRTPQESSGLASFANKSNLLGSPGSAERSLNIMTVAAILVYFTIAIKLNISNI